MIMYIPEELKLKLYPIITNINTKYNQDLRIREKIQFQKENTYLKDWIKNIFVSGTLEGDNGLEKIVNSIHNETDPIIQVCKFIYAYQIWDIFGDANAIEVSRNLKLKGYDINSLNNVIRLILFNETMTTHENEFEEHDEMIEKIESTPTFH